ncbi:hypothetical protein [Paraburkholderia caffeinilytica]|uniref:hypothetical protein n=1 Tax=Paraburkholderia caffeinilytica TaxID=1761016 RepID=UPI0038B81F3C
MQSLAETMAFEAVAAEYVVPVQAAGMRVGIIDICKADAASPDDLRRMLTRQLQRSLPKSVPLSVRADASTMPATEFAKTEQRVKAAVFEQAHESPELRPVITRDRSGRECTEYYGKKSGWMRPYQAPPMLAKTIGGQPVKLPVVL